MSGYNLYIPANQNTFGQCIELTEDMVTIDTSSGNASIYIMFENIDKKPFEYTLKTPIGQHLFIARNAPDWLQVGNTISIGASRGSLLYPYEAE